MSRTPQPTHVRLFAVAKGPQGRYLAVGGSVYLLELFIITLAQKAGWAPFWVVTTSFWIGLITSFILQKIVTFQDRRMHRQVVFAQIIAIGLLVLLNYSFTVAATSLLAAFLPVAVIRTIVLAITTIWNYYLYKTRIFNTDRETIY